MEKIKFYFYDNISIDLFNQNNERHFIWINMQHEHKILTFINTQL